MATKKKKEIRRCNLSINLSGYELEDIIEDYIKTQIGDVQNMYICVNNNNDNNLMLNAQDNEYQIYVEFEREII